MPDLTGARGITLHNPYAHLIAFYGKNIENRSWTPPESTDWLLIHAGKEVDHAACRKYWTTDLGDFDSSAIVAVARLAYVCTASRWTDTVVCGCGEWAMPGQCHWRLTEVTPLREPVSTRGWQKLWIPSPGLLQQVLEQLPAREVVGRA